MMMRTLSTLLSFGLAASAAPSSLMRRQNDTSSPTMKLVIGAPYEILTADFNGKSFTLTGKPNVTEGSAPSWMIYRESTKQLIAVNENANDTNVFQLDDNLSNPKWLSAGVSSGGVVSIAFNEDETKLVGAGYGSGTIDVWDVSPEDSSLTTSKQITISGPLGPGQTQRHPHQALLDPTKKFYVLPDLGGDQILVLDSTFTSLTAVTLPAGSGPRHGGFITTQDGAHFYVVACELSSEVFLFSLNYADNTSIQFTQLSQQSTYGAAFPPANATSAAAGEVAVASNNKDVYISNRLSGNETDSIAHFVFDEASQILNFADTVSSAGILPRMFSLSLDESHVFVANQAGDNSIVALKRCPVYGKLDPTPVATLPYTSVVAPQLVATPSFGPQFVQQIG
ncbi:putative isomerase YbhE [Xylariomycetidae sp. FL2044]|nr:putative isomerase YbhE [Xylariomycetidae sp. FL2044]